jgi:pyruvate/2-oxoglutarate dehydrogenase complex dihydrolipoamide acyltransferase (E2) component
MRGDSVRRFVAVVVTWAVVALLSAGCGFFRVPAVAPPEPAAPAPAPVPPPTPAPPPKAPAPAPPPAPPPVDVEALIVQAVAGDLGVSERFVRSYLAASGIDIEQRLAAAGIGADEVDDLIAEARARGVDTPSELRAFIVEISMRGPTSG